MRAISQIVAVESLNRLSTSNLLSEYDNAHTVSVEDIECHTTFTTVFTGLGTAGRA